MSARLQSRRTGVGAWRTRLSAGSATPAVLVLATYTFLLLSRLPELFPFLQPFRPILIMGVASIVLVAALPSSRLTLIFAAPEARAMLALFALAVAGIPTSVWPGGTFYFVIFGFSKTVLFFFLVLHAVRGLAELRYLVWAFVGAHAALEVGVLFLNVRERASVTGTYDPNDLAFVMVCALPMAVMLLVVERGWRRYLMAPVVVAGLLSIIMTKSRGGFVSLVVVGAIVLAKLPLRNPLIPVGVAVGGILVFSLFAPQSYWDRMATIGWGGGENTGEHTRELGQAGPGIDDKYESSGLSVRWKVWMTGIQIILANPFLGVGANSFSIAEGGQTFDGIGIWKAAHNSFIQLAAELGIPALVLFLYLLYRAIANYRRVIRIARDVPELRYHLWTAHGLEAGMYGYIVGGAALNHAYTFILYYLLAMSLVVKWVTLRDAARLREAVGHPVATGSKLPWWKAPR